MIAPVMLAPRAIELCAQPGRILVEQNDNPCLALERIEALPRAANCARQAPCAVFEAIEIAPIGQFAHVVDEAVEQCLAIGEVPVDGALRDTGSGREIADRQIGGTLLGNEIDERIEDLDPRASGLLLAKRAVVFPCVSHPDILTGTAP